MSKLGMCTQCNHARDIDKTVCDNCGNPDPFSARPKRPKERPLKYQRHVFWPLWEDREMAVIDEIAKQKDITPAEVIKAAVRLYQAHTKGAVSIVWPQNPGLPALEL